MNLENDEDDKIKEYLQRSDTAVIFPEPVTNELAKSKFEKSNCDLKDSQSLANSNDNNDDDDNGLKTDRNRMPENASSNNGKSDLFVLMHFEWLAYGYSNGILLFVSLTQENSKKGFPFKCVCVWQLNE